MAPGAAGSSRYSTIWRTDGAVEFSLHSFQVIQVFVKYIRHPRDKP